MQPFKLSDKMMAELQGELQPRLPLLDEREVSHGSFHDTASLAQTIKGCFRTMPRWNRLAPEQREAIDLICTKLARIMAGDPTILDHWKDIAGYAELGGEICDH